MAKFYTPGSKEYYDRFVQSPPSNEGGQPRFTADPRFTDIANRVMQNSVVGPVPAGGVQTPAPGGVYRTNKDGVTFFPDEVITNTPQEKKTESNNNGGGGGGSRDPYADYRANIQDLYNKVMGYGSYKADTFSPTAFNSSVDTTGIRGQLEGWLGEIDNYDPFKYDLNADMLYKQMADNYVQQGQIAMQDAMATAAALTGGYGNSFAAAVGNQAYQNHLTQLNNNIPALQQQALNVWQAGLDQLLNQYSAGSQQLNNLLNIEAAELAAWQAQEALRFDAFNANEANRYNEWLAGYNQVNDQYGLGVDHANNMVAMEPQRSSGGGGGTKTEEEKKKNTVMAPSKGAVMGAAAAVLPGVTAAAMLPGVAAGTNPLNAKVYYEMLEKMGLK